MYVDCQPQILVSSELWISVHIKLDVADPLLKVGLVKLPHFSVEGSNRP